MPKPTKLGGNPHTVVAKTVDGYANHASNPTTFQQVPIVTQKKTMNFDRQGLTNTGAKGSKKGAGDKVGKR